MEQIKAKRGLFAFLSLVICFPLFQYCFHFIGSAKLNGAVTNTANPVFRIEDWWNGSYQKEKEKHLNDSVGLRPDFVRLNNQMDLWLFGKLHARGVIAGKDGFLFEEPYIDEYNGSNYVADTMFAYELGLLKKIQDTLERAGKTLVLVEAASKGHYYPDKFPEYGRYRHKYPTNNYTRHIQVCDSLHIRHIDMNAWFLSMKDTTSPNKLFSKLGTHWTLYGALLAGDSLTKYLSRVRNIHLPSAEITKMDYSYMPRTPDADLAEGLNLAIPPLPEKLCYPEYKYVTDSATTQPKMIFIGDSFLWPFIYNGLIQHISNNWEFWYYFREVYKDKQEGTLTIDTYNWHKAIEETECIILVYNPSNLRSFSAKYSVIEAMYHHFYPSAHL